MKKLFAGLIAILVLATLTGCGIREKVQEKVAEGVTEKLLEQAEGIGDVDISGDKVTIKGEDGEEVSIGGTEWPTSELVQNIPEFTDGEVASVMESTDYILISLESVSEEAFTAYLDTIKEDFTVDPFEMTSSDGILYGAKNEDGIGVAVQYSDESATITVSGAEE